MQRYVKIKKKKKANTEPEDKKNDKFFYSYPVLVFSKHFCLVLPKQILGNCILFVGGI